MLADPHKLGNPDAFDALADLFLGQDHKVHAHEAAMGLPVGQGGGAGRATSLHAGKEGEESGNPASPAKLTLVSDSDDPSGGGPAAAPCIEALALGHLPVMAAAWASQYARHAADRVQAPIAFIRLSGQDVRIELHSPAGAKPQASRAFADAPAALEFVSRLAGRVILMTDTGREAELAQTPGIDRVTLLTSGDEAGIVAAYGLLKTLAQRLRAARGAGAESALRVAVMGAPPARAEFVIERLRDASHAFLNLDLKSDACIARIEAGSPGIQLYAGPLAGPVADLLLLITHTNPGRTTPPKEPTPAPTTSGMPIPAIAVPVKPQEPMGLPETFLGTTIDSLTIFIQGLDPLAARCPYAEEIELALDEDGVLHLLARAEGYGQRGRALERLTVASAWAEMHRRVLQLTLKDIQRPIAGLTPVMHVLTDQPAAWRTLLDSPVRVHMLSPVTVGSEWTCAPVN